MVLSRVVETCFSRYIGLPALRLHQSLRPKKRKIAAHFRESIQFRNSAAHWPTERKEKWVIERLRFVTRKAALETPYHKALFERIGFDPEAPFGFEEFASLPPLSRE